MIFNKKLLKTHKPSINSKEYKSTILYNGRLGLKAVNKGWLTLNQINAIKHFFKRFMKKRSGTVWFRIFPERFHTKKSLGNARMGKGKGALDKMMFYVKSGQIIFEVQLKRNALQNEIIAINMLKQCQYRLPILTKVFLSN